jgi:rhodanese-related sulfurtransferase
MKIMSPAEAKIRRRPARSMTRWRMFCLVLVLISLVVTVWHFRRGSGGPGSVAPHALLARIEAGDAPLVLDVRSAGEFASGHVPGARNMPVWSMLWRAADLGEPTTRPVVVYCEHGPRAMIAREILNVMGYTNIGLLEGHMSGWRRRNLATR